MKRTYIMMVVVGASTLVCVHLAAFESGQLEVPRTIKPVCSLTASIGASTIAGSGIAVLSALVRGLPATAEYVAAAMGSSPLRHPHREYCEDFRAAYLQRQAGSVKQEWRALAKTGKRASGVSLGLILLAAECKPEIWQGLPVNQEKSGLWLSFITCKVGCYGAGVGASLGTLQGALELCAPRYVPNKEVPAPYKNFVLNAGEHFVGRHPASWLVTISYRAGKGAKNGFFLGLVTGASLMEAFNQGYRKKDAF